MQTRAEHGLKRAFNTFKRSTLAAVLMLAIALCLFFYELSDFLAEKDSGQGDGGSQDGGSRDVDTTPVTPKNVSEIVAEFRKRAPGKIKLDQNFAYQFTILDVPSESWFAKVANGVLTVEFGTLEESDVQLSANQEHFIQLFTGKLSPITAYFSGKVKIKGQMSKLAELQKLL